MKTVKKIFYTLLFPHSLVVILLAIVSVIGLSYSFADRDPLPMVQYGSYVLSAYALSVVCLRMPKMIQWINYCRRKNPYAVRWQSDTELRVKLSLYASVGMNLAYSAFHIFMGVTNGSVWFWSLAGYYALLTLMRVLLLKDARRDTAVSITEQWKRYRLTGAFLIVMNAALLAVVLYIVLLNKGETYHFIQTIAMAAYTFTVLTVAVVNVVRYRKYRQPLISAVKFVSFAAALVSLLSLENAMLNVFGEENGESFRRLMTALTGIAVLVFILLSGIYMVHKASKEIRDKRNQ